MKEFRLPDSADYVLSYKTFVGSSIENFVCDYEGAYVVFDGAVYSREKAAEEGGEDVLYGILHCFPTAKGGACEINSAVKEIGEGAFYGNLSVESVIIPTGTEKIGKNAFYGCKNLRSAPLPEGLTEIGERAFAGSGVEEIVLPSTLVSLGEGAFGESAVRSVVFSSGENTEAIAIPDRAFYSCQNLRAVTFPARAEKIGSYAFYDCVSLSSVVFPSASNLKIISDYAFAFCDGLARVQVPSGVREIGSYAFYGREGSRAEPYVPKDVVTYIGDYAFANTRVTSYQGGGANVSYFGEGAFKNCRYLTQIQLPRAATFKKVPDYAFYGCTGLKSVIFNGNIEEIGSYAFYGCTAITSLTFSPGADGGGIKKIGDSAFENCKQLNHGASTESILPLSLTELGSRAFYGCDSLAKVVIPKKLLKIPDEAFASCVSLAEIAYVEGCGTDTLGRNSFAYCSSLKTAVLPPRLALRSENKGAIGNPFYGCAALTALKISGSDLLYSDDAGVVYAHDKTIEFGDGEVRTLGKVYLYPTGKIGEFVVGNDISAIDDYAFYGTRGITSLSFEINPSVAGEKEKIVFVDIGSYAFGDSSLSEVDVSYRIKHISPYAFYNSRVQRLNLSETAVEHGEKYDMGNTATAGEDNALTIGAYAFAGTQIVSLEIPKRTRALEEGAFADCYSLKSVVFAREYSSQIGVTLASDDLSIGARAFMNDSYLTYLSVPSRVTEIGSYAFAFCRNLGEVIFEDDESKSLTIGDHAFYGNHYLKTIALPSRITSLGEGAFYDCTRLVEIVFPENVKEGQLELPAYAFFACYNLTELVLPYYVTKIGKSAFENSRLEKLVFADEGNTGLSLSIEERAFLGTERLKELTLSSRLTAIGSYAFYRSGVEKTTVLDGENIITVSDYAFSESNLTSVSITKRIKLVGEGIFAGTRFLEDVALDATSYVDLPDRAFDHSGVISVEFYSAVKSIGNYAFSGTERLVELRFSAYSAFSVGDYAFSDSGITVFSATGATDVIIGNSAFFNSKLSGVEFNVNSFAAGFMAFADSAINKLVINADTLTLGEGFAAGAQNLERIEITDNERRYYCSDGVLYKDNALIQYPAGKRGAVLILDAAITRVEPYAFAGNRYLTTVTIPEEEKEVGFGENAFADTDGRFTLYVDESKVDAYSDLPVGAVAIQEGFGGLVLEAVGSGRYAVVGYTGTEREITVNGKITFAGLDFYIVKIGRDAFLNNEHVEKITLGAGITEVEEYAFSGARNLKSVTFGDNVVTVKSHAFEDCYGLEEAVFGKSLSSIGDYAFFGCRNLASVDLTGASVAKVGAYAFAGCGLASIKTGEKLTSIGNNAFEGNVGLISVVLPASVRNINDYVFRDCENLLFLFIEGQDVPALKSSASFAGTADGFKIFVSSFAEYKFKTASAWRDYSSKILSYDDISEEEGFEKYVLKKNSDGYTLICYLGEEADAYIKSDVNGVAITETGEYAFGHFTETITLGAGIKKIGKNSFVNAVNLRSVVSSAETVGDYAFYGMKNLTSLTFEGNSLKTIGNYAFYGCVGLVDVALPEKTETIGDYAFYGAKISSVEIKSLPTVTMEIGAYAFADNPDLKKIVFDCAVSKLGEGAFYGCSGLDSIYFNTTGSTIAKMDEGSSEVFGRCDLLNVFVPTESALRAYRSSSGWSQFDKNRLVVASFVSSDVINENGDVIKEQDGFVISSSESTSVASIISYVGEKTVVEFPSSIIVGGKEYTINAIGREGNNSDSHVNGCVIGSSVTEITIPSSVGKITGDAFRGAKGLRKINFAPNCSLTDIGSYAFAYCSSLERVTLPDSVRVISPYAFAYDDSLVYFSANERSEYAESSFLTIGTYAFAYSGLTEAELPGHVTSVDGYAFYKCAKFKNITFAPNGKTTSLGDYCFAYTALTELSLPKSMTSVGRYAFAYCEGLKSVSVKRELGGQVTSLTSAGANVFEGVTSPFVRIYVPSAAYGLYKDAPGWSEKTVIPDLVAPAYAAEGTALDGEYFNYRANGGGVTSDASTVTLTAYLGDKEEVVIPAKLKIGSYVCKVTTIDAYFGNERIKRVTFEEDSEVTNLNAYAFAGCVSLRTFVMADKISGAGEYVFAQCEALTDIILSERLSDIPQYAFSECVSLKEITIPASVKTIGNAAFINCASLNRLNVGFGDASILGMSALTGTDECLVIIVPENRKDAFANQWTEWSDRIYSVDSRYGDFVVRDSGEGLTLVQYNGNASRLVLADVVINGKKIVSVAENALPNGTVII
ncbi:MAG: leucine-rich repeat protein [Christensenellales bacterium]